MTTGAPGYLEEAAAILRKAKAANESRSGQFGTGQAVNAERLRIAEDFARLAAIERGIAPDGPAPDARIAAALRFATYATTAEYKSTFYWVIDQMVRALSGGAEDATMAGLGTSPAYERFREQVGEWDEGTAP